MKQKYCWHVFLVLNEEMNQQWFFIFQEISIHLYQLAKTSPYHQKRSEGPAFHNKLNCTKTGAYPEGAEEASSVRSNSQTYLRRL